MNSTKISSLLAPYGSMKFVPLATKVGPGDNGKTPGTTGSSNKSAG